VIDRFIATGLVLGLLPNHLVLPALPDTTNWWSELAPIVAAQVNKINLVSPEGILIVAYFRLLPLIEQMFQQNEQLQLLDLVLTQYKILQFLMELLNGNVLPISG
jgi:hypothetical protein